MTSRCIKAGGLPPPSLAPSLGASPDPAGSPLLWKTPDRTAPTAKRSIFHKIAACSPGLLVPDSQIYTRYAELLEQKVDRSATQLYMYVNGPEIVGPCKLFRTLGIEFLRFIDMVRDQPLPGLRLSTHIGMGENHYTGIIDAYKGFLRECYRWADAPEVMNTPASMRHMMRPSVRLD